MPFFQGVGGIDVQVFDTAGAHVWTKPGNAQLVEVYCVGGGGGGGGGSNGAGGVFNGGGGGGGGGGRSLSRFLASDLGATENLVVGAGGAGGIGAVAANSDATAAVSGALSSFGSILLVAAMGGTAGGKRNAGLVDPPGGYGNLIVQGSGIAQRVPSTSTVNSPNQGLAGATNTTAPAQAQIGTSTNPGLFCGGGGGGGGGGNPGSASSDLPFFPGYPVGAGGGGTGVPGAAGAAFGGLMGVGGGGGGGGGNNGGAAGGGGVGAQPGGGGGGGGASQNNGGGGNGGNGGDGVVIVITWLG